MSDSSDNGEIKIIASPPPMTAPERLDYLPRDGESPLGPEPHFGFAFFTRKPVTHLTDQIDELKGKIRNIVKTLAEAVTENAELEEVTIGLAVSVDGDIGIASAGAEASIELTYKIKH